MRYFLFILISALFVTDISGQQEDYYTEEYFRYSTHIYDTNIHSLQVHRRGAPLTDPVAEINNLTESLELSFDDFRDNTRDYRYTFIHCDAYWQPSDILVSDYLQGFDDDYVEEYEFSYNTKQPFIHYKLHFPQQDMLPVLSGNYLLKVYPAGSPDKPVLSARFYILDEKVSIQPNIRQATAPTKMDQWHEVDFVINAKDFYLANPSRNMKVIVQQNGRHDNKITGIQPSEIQGNEFIFDYEDQNLFRAGNEFRDFNIQNLKYQSDQVQRIDSFGEQNQVYLYPDTRRTFNPYVNNDDINGRRLIKTTEYDNTATEADYVRVHFTLPMENPVANGSIHILGGLNYWELNNRSKMTYNYEEKAYENSLYLKQGYYNYLYAYKEDGKSSANLRLIENSLYETENEYTIYVYYNHPGSSYDQFIGKKTVSSGE
ncbi:MAG: DUF5103 domain-containing protein [Bacteroidota bacterium]